MRWRKKEPPRNAIVVDANLIKAVFIDNLNFDIPEVLVEFVMESSDDLLELLGESVASDPEVWGVITEAIVDYVTAYKFADILTEGGLLHD